MSELINLVNQKFRLGDTDTKLALIIGEGTVFKLKSKFNDSDLNTFISTLQELVRFLYLSAHAPSSVFFPGDDLMDDLWHALIIETQDYRELCNRLRPGCFIDHSGIRFSDYLKTLTTEQIHEEQASWLASYYANFGPINDEAFKCLRLAKSMAKRMECDLKSLNAFAKMLADLPQELKKSDSPIAFSQLLKTEVRPFASNLDWDPIAVKKCINTILSNKHASEPSEVAILTNTELEALFGESTALAFCLWQHLAAVERLAGLPDWQNSNQTLWNELSTGKMTCGLATTHLASPTGSSLLADESTLGFKLTGKANWVCGYQVFDKLLVGFKTSESVIFAIIDFPVATPDRPEITLERNDLANMNGTATVSIQFNDYFVPRSAVVSQRSNSIPAKARPSNYKIPELGIGKRALQEVTALIASSSHPKMQLMLAPLSQLNDRLLRIAAWRASNNEETMQTVARDEFNRDAIRLLALATGANALLKNSLVSRLQMETLLLDVIVQAPDVLVLKIKSTSGVPIELA